MLNLLRNRTFVTLAVLIALGIGIGVAHSRSLNSETTLFWQEALRAALLPTGRVVHTIAVAGDRTAQAVRPRVSLLRENARLRREVRELALENSRLREAAEENVRLRTALGLKQTSPLKMTPAEVISRRQSTWFDTATINRGRRSGIVRGAAVITPRGLVGQVLEANAFTSHVVSITGPDSAVGAMIQRSRSTGMLIGQGVDYPVLSYLPKDADVKIGDVVISAGMSGVIPKGIVVGRVAKVARSATTGTTSALVRPSVRFDQIEQVFVVEPEGDLGP